MWFRWDDCIRFLPTMQERKNDQSLPGEWAASYLNITAPAGGIHLGAGAFGGGDGRQGRKVPPDIRRRSGYLPPVEAMPSINWRWKIR